MKKKFPPQEKVEMTPLSPSHKHIDYSMLIYMDSLSISMYGCFQSPFFIWRNTYNPVPSRYYFGQDNTNTKCCNIQLEGSIDNRLFRGL